MLFKEHFMAGIIIQTEDSDNLKLISRLAKKLGIHVSTITDEQSEDMALGNLMIKSKTGKSVSKEAIMTKLSE